MNMPVADPYAVRTFDQFLQLFDNGDFLQRLEEEHKAMCKALFEHYEANGEQGCKGMMTIKVAYQMPKLADLQVAAQVESKTPKPRPAMAAMYGDEQGNLSLYSPLMKQRDTGLRDVQTVDAQARDVTPHDPETGEVRDVS